MKNLSQDYKTHIAGNVTTLATLVKIVRKDLTDYYFTDYDKEISYDGNIYSPVNSFTPTDFQSSATLSVDNLDITGIISEIEGITEGDIYREFFYDAKIWVSTINYKNTGQGINKILYGSLGEVSLQENKYMIEFRNLTYKLTNRLSDVFSKTCRAELGDTKCGIKLEPPVWQPNTFYCSGAVVSSSIFDNRRYVATNSELSNPDGLSYHDTMVSYLPEAYWKFNESIGATEAVNYGTEAAWALDYDYGVTPTLETAGLLASTNDTAAYFNGTNNVAYAYLSGSMFNGASTRWSVTAWIKVGALENGGTVFSLSRTTLTDYVQLHITGGRAVYTKYVGSITFNFQTDLTTLNDGNPHFIVWTGDGFGEKIYVDGVSVACTTTVGTYGNNTFYVSNDGPCVGAIPGSPFAQYFEGIIDEVSAHEDHALNPEKIANLYKAGSQLFDYKTIVTNKSPTSYWRLGESSGATTAIDLVGSNDGTYINTPTLETAALIVDTDSSVTLDKTNSEYISIPAAVSINNIFSGGATIEAWFNPSSAIGGGVDSSRLLSKDDGVAAVGSGRNGWAIQIFGDSKQLAFYHRFEDGVSTTSYTQAFTGSVIPENNIYHVVISYNSNSPSNLPTIWINGVSQSFSNTIMATAGHTASDDSTAILCIGGIDPAGGQSRYFDGIIDEVVIYPTILTGTQVAENYKRGLGAIEPVWNTTLDGSTVEDSGLTWITKDSYLKQGKANGPLDYRLYIKYGDDNSGGTMGVEEFSIYDDLGIRRYPISCTLDGGSIHINSGCDKLSDDTASSWRGLAPWTDRWATLTFSDYFVPSRFEITVIAQAYIREFYIQYSLDSKVTWNTIYSFSGGNYAYWTSIARKLVINSTNISYSAARFLITDNIYTDMNYIVDGTLTWLTGDNTGLSMEIKKYDSTKKEITLFKPMAFPIKFGDTFEVIPGCNHLYLGHDGTTGTGHCIVRYNNGNNFVGEPFVPTEDVLVGGIGETNKEAYVD